MKLLQYWLMRWALSWYRWRHPDMPQRLDVPGKLPFTPRSFLVFANTALGDTLLCTPGIASIRDSWPEARITLFVHSHLAPLFDGYELIDLIIVYHGGYRHFWRSLRQLRTCKPDVALLLHSNGPQDIPSAVLSGAHIILKPSNDSPDQHWLSARMPARYQHVIEDKLDTLRFLGATAITSRMQLPSRYHLPAQRQSELHVGFQPGAANIYKMWPTECFGALAKQLLEARPALQIHILGTQNESDLAERIIAHAGSAPRLLNQTGRYSIQELPLAIKKLDLLISNDTGTMHLGIALGVPTICLFAPTDPTRIGPYQDVERHTVICRDGKFVQQIPKKKRSNIAMQLITVEEVLSAALRHLPATSHEDSTHH